VTPQRLADVLETLADGPPWDTGWLRSVLPELAVRGRLVGQEEGVTADCVQHAVRQVHAVQRELISQGQLAKPRAIGSPLNALSSRLPQGWVAVPLAAAIEYDLTDGDWVESVDQDPDGDVRLIQLADVGVGEFRDRSDRHLTSAKAAELRCTYLLPNDVLIARLPDPLGRACLFPGSHKPCVTVVDVAIARTCGSATSAAYLVLCMNSPMMQRIVVGHATGTTRQRVSTGNLRRTCIPLPPLAEQHRIVAKVDELMGHAKVLEERYLAATSTRVRLRDAALHALAEAEDHAATEIAWARIDEHFEDLFTEPEDVAPLRQAILQLAVRGRLVGQDARDCVQAIGSRDDSVPKGWARAELSQCASIATCLVDPSAYLDAVHVAPDNIESRTGRLLTCRTIRDDGMKSAKHRFRAGQILYSKIRPALGKCVIASFDGLCSADMYPIETSQVTRFLHLVMLSPEFTNATSVMANRVKMPKVNQQELGSVRVPLPPIAEQHRIVAKVDELMAICDTLEASLTRAKACREQFAGSISAALSVDPPKTPDRNAA
jgi:type I restriction enzyme S subunit